MTFRPRNVERLGDRIDVPIPRDGEGFLGRECPEEQCLGYFKIEPGTGLTGSDLPCHCPYCGLSDGQDKFWTPEQIEYARSVALRRIADAFRTDLKQLEFDHKARGALGIGISMKLQPGAPIAIRHYREKQLETRVTCDSCTLEYAVYGVFAYCPDCGAHNSYQILEQNLALVDKQLDLAESLQDLDLRRHLLEDALENCVSTFDGFGREACRVASARLVDPSKVRSISFQNLTGADDRLEEMFGFRIRSGVRAEVWNVAYLGFMRRHLIAHSSGVVDQKYADATKDLSFRVGRRLNVSSADIRDVAGAVRNLGRALLDQLNKA